MKKKRRIISLLLIFALVVTALSGCKKSGESSGMQSSTEEETVSGNGTGRFMESKVVLPDGVERVCAMKKLSDGSLEVIGEGNEGGATVYYLLNSSDYGANWNISQVQGLDGGSYQQMAIAPDGTAVFIPYTQDGIVKLKIADIQGETTEIAVSVPASDTGREENHISQADYDSAGNLIVRDSNSSLYKIDTSAGTCGAAFETEGVAIRYFGLAGTKCIAVHDQGILVYNTVTGEKGDVEPVIQDLIKGDSSLTSVNTDSGCPMVFAEGADEGSILFVNSNGVFHFAIGGSISEQLLDSSLTSLGGMDAVFYGVCMMDAENIFVCANDGQGTNLFRYSYDSAAAAVPEQEITVYSLDDSSTLRHAVTVFQSAHPDIYVNLQIGMSGEDGVTLEDALKVLNTDIMAGKGPDVLILDGMPIDSYIEKGILADISDVVKEVDQEDGLFSNIVKASEADGHIYAMPARFLIPLVDGDADTVKAASSLETLADRAEELKAQGAAEHVMQERDAKKLLRELYYADSAAWETKDGALDEEKLTNYLTQAKRIYDVDQYDSDENSSSDGGTTGGLMPNSLSSEGQLTGEFKVAMGTLSDVSSFQLMRSAQAKTGNSYGLNNAETARSYVPYLMAGVASDGNTEAAKAFVKTLLGKEAGSATNGIPVNRAAFDQQIADTAEAAEMDMSIAFSGADSDEVYGVEYMELTEQDITDFTELIEGLTTPALTDRTIQSLVLEQGEKYLSGEQSLEAAVSAILKKVNLYLSE